MLTCTLGLTDKDYKAAQILPLSSRLMSNKGRFVHKILSGRAPMYLSTKLFINQSSRNSSRKLNVPIPRIDLFKSSLVYSGSCVVVDVCGDAGVASSLLSSSSSSSSSSACFSVCFFFMYFFFFFFFFFFIALI